MTHGRVVRNHVTPKVKEMTCTIIEDISRVNRSKRQPPPCSKAKADGARDNNHEELEELRLPGTMSALEQVRASLPHDIECLICMQDVPVDENGKVNVLTCCPRSPCGPFHLLCVDCWERLKHRSCPLCRDACKEVHAYKCNDLQGFLMHMGWSA